MVEAVAIPEWSNWHILSVWRIEMWKLEAVTLIFSSQALVGFSKNLNSYTFSLLYADQYKGIVHFVLQK